MTAAWVHGHLRRLLVDPPSIANFEYHPDRTFGASFPFVALTVVFYLSLTLVLHRLRLPLPSPSLLRRLSAAHSAALLLLSIVMSLGCALSALHQSPSPRWLLCFPPATPPKGPVFFWAHVFHLSKIYELLDTLLIVLSGGRRLTFLHVYHHAAAVVMSYLWLAAAQSLFPVALVTNAGVHVVMYGYYLSCSVGWRWPKRWKRLVTEVQIVQFVFSFAASGGFLWLHFTGEGCKGMGAWVFNAGFNVSLLALFVSFHAANYEGVGRRKEAAAKEA